MTKPDKPGTLRPKHPRYRGVVYIWVVTFLLLLILFVGLTLDMAKAYYVSHQLQNAADAAALAGARVVKLSQAQARQKAYDIAFANFADVDPILLGLNDVTNDPNGDIVVGRYDPGTATFTVTTVAVNALKVVARRTDSSLGGPVALNFGPIIGINTCNISNYAIAKAQGGTGAGLIALDSNDTGLTLSGGINLDVSGGAIQINSEAEDPVVVSGQSGDVTAEEINIVSGDPIRGDLPEDLPIGYNEPPIPDPLAFMDPPTSNEANDLSPFPRQAITEIDIDPNNPFEPGYYSGGFRFTSGDAVLAPGIYILNGSSSGPASGLFINGGNFTAEGVMFYIIEDYGVVDIGGNGNVTITPMESGYYEGMSIFQSRDNHNDAKIIGTSNLSLAGTLYFPENFVELGGNEDWTAGNQFIANTMWIHGNATITIDYDGRNPAPGNRSFLVE